MEFAFVSYYFFFFFNFVPCFQNIIGTIEDMGLVSPPIEFHGRTRTG